jgi:iron complex outermembrane receptor protein
MAGAGPASAGEVVAQAEEVPETILITGSLIRGTAAVGVPVTNLNPQDFAMTGALTTADLFRSFPAANVGPGPIATQSGANIERGVKVNLRGLDTGSATRSLMMIDGMRFPGQGNGQCVVDPSIIPALSMDHIDVLVDGASATYGSDAVGGVINIILKRNMDGAITQARWTTAEGGKNRYMASAVWGRTWDGGQVTISYEWYHETPIKGNAHSKFGQDHRPWGFDDRRPLASSLPATLSTSTPTAVGGGPNVGTSAQLGHGCTNCYAVPLGAGQNWEPGATGIGPPAKPIGQPLANPYGLNLIDWTSFNTPGNSGTNGLRNQFDPYDIAWYDAQQERNGGHITVDQRLTSNISFYGSAFYSNRRAKYLNPGNLSPAANNAIYNFAVPTFNPYYPINAPANLRANYNLSWESPPITASHELAQRYQLGLNIALPANWSGRVWYAMTNDQNFSNPRGLINRAAVSAALGWTMPVTLAAGTTPAIATWSKPANVPYLNLFCDPLAYQCNSDTTLEYIEGIRYRYERYWINEKGGQFDGPLFDIPGGTVKAAVGATYTSFRLQTIVNDNTGATNLIVPYQVDAQGRQVWAIFTQINAPLFSEQNGFFGMRRLELEFSWRHDQYSDVKGTSNPKVAFNWAPIEDFTVRGTWGTSFRAPVFGELSPLSNVAIAGWNLGGFAPATAPINTGCPVSGGSLPPVGSGAWKLQSSLGAGGDGSPGSATACNAAFNLPAGISMNGGSGGAAAIREGGGWDGSFSGLTPELATNWGIGFDYTPSGNFLTGLNIQATYYVIKINRVLRGFGNPTTNDLNDPSQAFAFLVPTDFANNPNLPGSAACTSNLLPETCEPFQNAVRGLLANPRNTVDPQARTLIYWINDGGTFNKGWLKTDGFDWSVSYDWDWGDVGAFNIGMVGTYYLHQKEQTVDGGQVEDSFNTTNSEGQINEAVGVTDDPRMRYRARLGWSNGPWSLTGFMDYVGHFHHNQGAPPNVNGSFCASNGGLDEAGGGGTFPCAIQGYTNILPSQYTFDLSLGYNTMDAPANEYLRNIGVQLVVQNITNRHSSYGYRISTGGGNPCTCDITKNLQGRTISLIVTKQW